MSVPTITLTGPALFGVAPHLMTALQVEALPVTVKLGRKRPRSRTQALHFERYFKQAAAPLPDKVDYAAKASYALGRMYLNDRYGDCVVASRYHAVGLWSGNDTDTQVVGTDAEVYSSYQTICGPGDNGCIITHVLDYMRSHGLPFAGKLHKIDGYVACDWRKQDEVKAAIYLMPACSIGLNLPQAWTSAAVWDVTNTPIVGGHDVCLVGYDSRGVQIASWGRIYTITWAAFTSTKWLEEMWVMLAPDWYNDDQLAPNGVDVAQLKADLAMIGQGQLPPIDPAPLPPTPPVPPVPPTPSALGVVKVHPNTGIIDVAGGWTINRIANNNTGDTMYPYPTDFPLDEIQTLLLFVKGQAPPVPDVAHAAWGLIGYGLRTTLGGTMLTGSRQETTLQAKLEQLVQANAMSLPTVIDWAGLIKQIIADILSKLLG